VNVEYPLHFDGRERTATVDDAGHIRDMVEQVLFTAPGERVNRPDFGSGIEQLVFAPTDGELAQATKALVQGALQRALGELIRVEEVVAEADEATLRVTVVYGPVIGGAPTTERRSVTVTGGTGAGT
jgi:uncharacterized protein